MKHSKQICTQKIYGKTYKDHNPGVARYLLIAFLLQLHKKTVEVSRYPWRTSECSITALATNMPHGLFSDTLILPCYPNIYICDLQLLIK